jgi:hypothetical protein
MKKNRVFFNLTASGQHTGGREALEGAIAKRIASYASLGHTQLTWEAQVLPLNDARAGGPICLSVSAGAMTPRCRSSSFEECYQVRKRARLIRPSAGLGCGSAEVK